ncbi:hypothetical protein AXG93_1534s1000 [Marchantia polymorpha subsp. ruderalis]|uniref:Uncharacterized protein n=1 Tax=Marchantia polymorpha subsp. ruderalis TaxID=1480154 RepID=A0A176W041_MARPO|nr:hypothetical protein AXG93_1534s1000 [Marchantia polymorpha subsp. ruderalis]
MEALESNLLLVPLLAILDAVYWCAVGLETLALVLIVLVALTPCVAVVWFLALHVVPLIPKDQTGDEVFFSRLFSHNDRLGRQAIFALSTVLLFFVLRHLDDCVTKKDPRSDFFVWCFDVAKRIPPVPNYIASVALHLLFSAIAAFYFSAFFTAFVSFITVPIWILIFFLDMSLYVSWYILLPLVLFSLLLILSLSRRIMHSYLAKRRSGSESLGRNVRDA